MVPEKDKISLIVKCDYSPPLELRVLREKRSQQAANSDTDLRVEVVEDEFRHMLRRNCVMANIFL